MSEPLDREHGEWDALAVGWALSALDPADEERFADHLPGCARCTATVRESLYTVADLAYALPDEAPPPAMKSRLMAAVAAEPREALLPSPALAPEEEWPLGEPHPGTPGYRWFDGEEPAPFSGGAPDDDARPPASPQPDLGPMPERHSDEDISFPGRQQPDAVIPLEPHRRRRAGRRVIVAAAAAAVLALIAGLAVWNVQLRGDQQDLRQVVAQRDAAIKLLTANGPARVAAMTTTGKPAPTRQATLVVRGNQVEIIIETLGATTGNETYWLWTLNCSTPKVSDLKPIQGFRVTQSEFSVRDIGSEPGVATATCFAISSEVTAGTPTTPRQVVAVGVPS